MKFQFSICNRNLLRISYLIFLFNLYSCESTQHKGNANSQNTITADTIETKYIQIDQDTVVFVKELLLYNLPYKLTIKKYCLNDSAIIKEIIRKDVKSNGPNKILEFSHNYAVYILLTQGTKEIISRQVSKETFTDSLAIEFYRTAMLHDVKYEAVRTNRLYFTANLLGQLPGYSKEINFAIFYQTEKKGQLDFWLADTGE